MENSGIQKAVNIAGSQRKLAALIGVSNQSISNWVKAGRAPAEWAAAIEFILGGQVNRKELNEAHDG